jgi:hypothetical protein
MADELPPDDPEQDAADDGGDPEVPLLDQPHEVGFQKRDPSKPSQLLARCVEATDHALLALGHRVWKWSKLGIQSANFWIAVATIAIAVSTGIYTHYAGLQWQVMEGQLEEMRAARQPWVGLENNSISVDPSPEFGPSHPPNPNFMILENTAYSIRNFGTAPALHESDIVVAIPDTCTGNCIPPTDTLSQWCFYPEGMSTTRGAANPGAGQMVLPGASIPVRKSATLIFNPTTTQHIQRVWFFVCIAYQDPWNKGQIHHSRYWYLSVHPTDPFNGPQAPVPTHPGFTYIPISGLGLWGADAD